MNTYKKNKLLLTVLCLLTLTVSCTNQYNISTNLDRENFKHYFSPTSVNIYKDENLFPAKYKFIGLVEGQDCQRKAHQAAPDDITARTDARRKAAEMKANAIIFTGCAPIVLEKITAQCLQSIVCYGKAYQIEKLGNE